MGTGTVRRIRQRAEAPTLSEAIAAYLATLDHPETAGTRRVYASTLRQLRAYLGPELPVATLDEPDTATRLAGWLAARWGTRAPATIQPAEKQSDYVEVVLSKLRGPQHPGQLGRGGPAILGGDVVVHLVFLLGFGYVTAAQAPFRPSHRRPVSFSPALRRPRPLA